MMRKAMVRRTWSAGLVFAMLAGASAEVHAQQPPAPGAEGAPAPGRSAPRRSPAAPRGTLPPPVQWAQPLGPSGVDRPGPKRARQTAEPEERRGGDPTAVVPSLRPLLDPTAAGGAAGSRALPPISVRGRVVSRTGRAAAILDVGGTMIGVEAGSRFDAGGQTIEVEDVGVGGTVLRVLDTDRVITR